MRFDDLPLEPVSDHYGYDRGTPLDRRYIETFLDEHKEAVRGSVLEVQDDGYTRRFGATAVVERTIVDIDASNRSATLNADLCRPGSLPADAYDCIILTQTLHLLRDPRRCIENCHTALRRKGALLVTAPSLSRTSPTYPDADYWRFTPAGARELFGQHWKGDFKVHSWGNLQSCLGFLIGTVAEDLPDAVFDQQDPRFGLTVGLPTRRSGIPLWQVPRSIACRNAIRTRE